MTSEALSVLQPYCENDMQLLKRISRSIFMRFNESLTRADYDDFYSIANMTLWQAYNAYDPDNGVSFDGFLHTCLQKKFKTELTSRHRQKRILNQFAVSLDAVNDNEEEYNLLDFIASDLDTFDYEIRQMLDISEKEYTENMQFMRSYENEHHSINLSKGYKIPVAKFRAVVKLSRFVNSCYSNCTFSLPIFESVS